MDFEKEILKLIKNLLPKKMRSMELSIDMDLKDDLGIDSLKLVVLAVEYSDLIGIDLADIDDDPSSIRKIINLIDIAKKYKK